MLARSRAYAREKALRKLINAYCVIPFFLILLFSLTALKKNFGTIAALVTVTMMSLMSAPVVYNVEARMYSLAALFVLLSFYYLHKILCCSQKKDWILFAAAGNTKLNFWQLTKYAIGGLQLLCLGIMGQYIAKTYLEVKKRPHYIIREHS